MKTSRWVVSSFAAFSLLTVSGCVTDPTTGQKKVSRTAIGAGVGVLGGLLLGGLIGGGAGRILGAGIGGVAGAAIGSQNDKQIRELKEQTAGTGVAVAPANGGEAILVDLPGGVTFDPGSYALRPDFRPALDRVADSLRQYPDSLVDVYGYADANEGVDNQMLSENRARTVANYLVTRGVSDTRIRSQGFGATMPVDGSNSEAGRTSNRRAEIKIVPISQEQVQAARTGGQ